MYYQGFRTFSLLLGLCLFLTSCSSPSSETPQAISLPEPEAAQTRMILGEPASSSSEIVTLYYASADSTSFSTINRTLRRGTNQQLCVESLNMLFETVAMLDDSAKRFVSPRLTDVECSRGIVTVNLSMDVLDYPAEQDVFMLVAGITNTLLSLDFVSSVNVLVNHRAFSFSELPLGIQTKEYSGITPAYAQFNAERDYFLVADTASILRSAALYFPSARGDRFIPELQTLEFDSTNYASILIDALRKGPSETSSTMLSIPESEELLIDNPYIERLPSGESVINLKFSNVLPDYLTANGLAEWSSIGSLVLTLCSFVPEIDAVRIYFDGQLLESCVRDGRTITFPQGLIRRNQFSSHIGDVVQLFLPMSDGSLERIECAEAPVRVNSAQSLLIRLWEETQSHEGTVFPAAIASRDLLGVAIENGIAHVNLSANFYRQAQTMDNDYEQSVIYSMVNTLCDLENVSGVRFYIEGHSSETLSGQIYLKGILLPNPGMVRTTVFP